MLSCLCNIDRMQKAQDLAAKFVVALDEELTASSYCDIPESHLRCQCTEKNTFRRCLHVRSHEGKCKFTTTKKDLFQSLSQPVSFRA
jgi:hypothetical protein